MHAHLPSLLSSLRQLTHELLILLDRLDEHLAPSGDLPALLAGPGTRPWAGPAPGPFFPAAVKGGLGYEDLRRHPDARIVVLFGPWDGFEDNDTAYLVPAGGSSANHYASVAVSAADKYEVVQLDVPAMKLVELGEGPHRFEILVEGPLGVVVRSPVTEVLIQLEIPGGPDNVADTPYLNERLQAPQVVPPVVDPDTPLVTVTLLPYRNELDGRTAPYAYMRAGDSVRLRWGHQGNERVHEVTQREVDDGAAIVFTVDDAMLKEGGYGSQIAVNYDITNRVGTWSLWSPASYAKVDDPLAPGAPEVTPTVGNEGKVIDLDTLGDQPVQVHVLSGLRSGDRVVVYAVCTTAEGTSTTRVTAEQTYNGSGIALVFPLEKAWIEPLAQGRLDVYFTYVRGSNAPVSSLRRRLSVIGQLLTLPAPVAEAAVGGVIDTSTLPDALYIRIAQHDLIGFGARVIVTVEGTAIGGGYVREEATVDIGNPLPPFPLRVALPVHAARQLEGASMKVSYVVDTYDAVLRRWVQHSVVPNALYPSPSAAYRVVAGSAKLAAPVIEEAKGDTLDLQDIPGETVRVHIRPTGLALGNQVTLEVRGDRDSAVFRQQFIVRELPFAIGVPKSPYFSGNENGSITATYELSSGGEVRESEALKLKIGAGLGELPKPVVPQESAGHLLPGSILDGVTIQVPVSVKLKPTDQVYAYFATWPSAPKAGVIPVSFQVPADVLGPFMGADVDIWYVVEHEGVPYASGKLSLHMMPFGNEDKLLPTPAITQASGNVLDLATFNGNATATCLPWPFIAQGQRVWLRVHGTKDNGSADAILVYDGDAVTADMVTKGLSKAVNRARLEALRDNSTITVELKVAFNPADDEAKAITFPKRIYTIRTVVEALKIVVSPSSVQVGGAFTASASGGRPLYRFSASPTSVATIGADGKGGSAKAVGNCTITVTDDAGRTASQVLSVAPALTISVNPSSVNEGDSFTASASGGKPSYQFSASPTSVATIDANGQGGKAKAEGNCSITVRDSLGSSASRTLTVYPSFDFDTSPIRDIKAPPTGEEMRFEGTFTWFFDRNHLPVSEQLIGVKAVTGSKDDYYKGRVLRIGDDSGKTNVDKHVLCLLAAPWGRVRFSVSSVNRPFVIDFYEDLGSSFNGDLWSSLKRLDMPATPTDQKVDFSAPSGKKIKWIRIRCTDTIHLDFFKFNP